MRHCRAEELDDHHGATECSFYPDVESHRECATVICLELLLLEMAIGGQNRGAIDLIRT